MGLDRIYQAIPATAGLIERAREDAALGEWLGLVPSWFRKGPGGALAPGKPDPGELELWQRVRALLEQQPGLEERNCDLGRSWDQLHYVLSAHRRGEPGSETDALLDMAVRGESLIAEHVRSGQGVPVRYTPPERVAELARVLTPMTWESLEKQCVPDRMEAAGVYKFFASHASEQEWTWLREYFHRFRAFYLTAAEHGNTVLVCTD
ncbi:DUF1877 family protein [Archangium violaceum]|uniref:DUF1877 family protein n=1 Tax=Archangium violaceum TaxID=83451 RepID=UPI002B2874B2|nr:DUF1877 family protein [Archangium gephyra]